MRILSFDQASQKSAWAIFVDSNLSRWNLINLSKNKDVVLRTEQMYCELNSAIVESGADIVVFEDVNFRVNPKTVIQLAQIQGAIMQSCYLNNIPFCSYEPGAWRKIVGIPQGKGIKRPELKQSAIDFVKKSYGISVNDDTAESICIGLAYLKDHNLLPDLNNLKRAKNKK